MYRALFPEEAHNAYLFLRNFQNADVPTSQVNVPLANDSTLPDSQKVRFELKYLVKIFNSWKEAYAEFEDVVSLSNLLSMQTTKTEKGHVQYEHDGLEYESFYRMGVKGRHGEKHFYLQIPLSNNGYLYRTISAEEILHSGISLHRGTAHPQGIAGYVSLTEIGSAPLSEFVRFAVNWFGCEATSIRLSVFYNGPHNRVDIRMERLDFPRIGDKVSLEFCFEPGFPVQNFQSSSFAVTQEFMDGSLETKAATK
jgi:hypothetical protein